MGLEGILNLFYESLYAIVIFSAILGYASFRGRQATINLIMGLYFALLLASNFPYRDELNVTAGDSSGAAAFMQLALFAGFTVAATILFARLMPDEFQEKAYESFGKKLLIALVGTILILTFTYQVLPVGSLVDTSTPLQWLFADTQYFFYWLLVPLIILFLL